MSGRVTVEPSRACFDVEDGESIMGAAQRSGFAWPTLCGGNGTCRLCVLRVADGVERLSAVGPLEAEGLDMLGLTGPPRSIRLACQARVLGDVVVRKSGVRPR